MRYESIVPYSKQLPTNHSSSDPWNILGEAERKNGHHVCISRHMYICIYGYRSMLVTRLGKQGNIKKHTHTNISEKSSPGGTAKASMKMCLTRKPSVLMFTLAVVQRSAMEALSGDPAMVLALEHTSYTCTAE